MHLVPAASEASNWLLSVPNTLRDRTLELVLKGRASTERARSTAADADLQTRANRLKRQSLNGNNTKQTQTLQNSHHPTFN